MPQVYHCLSLGHLCQRSTLVSIVLFVLITIVIIPLTPMRVCYDPRHRETTVAMKGKLMSRFIKHINGLERRIGKKVKVNSSEIFEVTRGEAGTLMVGPYRFSSQRVLDTFLEDHTIAAAGYTRDCGERKKFTDKVSDIPLNTQVEVVFQDFADHGWILGEFRYIKEVAGNKDMHLFFLSNDSRLDGCIAEDKFGYNYSWAVAEETSCKTSYPVKFREVLTDGKEGMWQLEGNTDVVHTVRGKLKYYKKENSWLLLTDSDDFDGQSTPKAFQDGYKYSWWICDGAKATSGIYHLKYIDNAPVKAQAEPEVPHEYIMDTPCIVGKASMGLVEGMLVFQEKEYYILTNNKKYSGAPAPDMKGYKYSWVIGDKEDAKILGLTTKPLEESSKDNLPDPSGNQLVRIAEALERIAKALEK